MSGGIDDRRQKITQYILPGAKGIEIGPWCNPLTPKRSGYNCTILDVFDTLTLKSRARADVSLTSEQENTIEDVDVVGSSSKISELIESIDGLGTFDYIVSSHNLEHVPDLVKFFQGCEKVLKPGGILSMAIPDRRGCFDYFRPNSSLAEVLESHYCNRDAPSAAQIFEHCSLYARQVIEGVSVSGFHTGVKATNIKPFETLRDTFNIWKARLQAGDSAYVDAHCWTFTPSSFELIFIELSFLGLTKLELFEVEAVGGEFHVHLRNKTSECWSEERFYDRRLSLLQKINDENCVTSPLFQEYISQVEEHKENSRAGVEEFQVDLQELERRNLVIFRENELLKFQLEDVKLELLRSNQLISDIKNSSSWKYTAPIRQIIILLRGFLQGNPREAE